MKVAILGTGKMGRALARELSRSNDVIVGSRGPARAKEAAKRIPGATGSDYGSCRGADAVVAAIPASALGSLTTRFVSRKGGPP